MILFNLLIFVYLINLVIGKNNYNNFLPILQYSNLLPSTKLTQLENFNNFTQQSHNLSKLGSTTETKLSEKDLLFHDSSVVSFSKQRKKHRRLRRTPAVWGEPAPDYSAAYLQDESTFLYALLFVDGKISDHYQRDSELMKSEVMKLAQEANRYFYQIKLHLVIVNIIETMRNDLSLYTFESYRNQRINELPYHNFAALISYRYAGGLAFVSGMCNAKSVMLAGFYPHNPEAMGSIFFHEVAHLIGVPHSNSKEPLNVPNCVCPERNSINFNKETTASNENDFMKTNKTLLVEKNGKNFDDNDTRSIHSQASEKGCLRIPGFDHDCTLQLMANLVYRNRCLAKEPLLPPSTTLPTADATPTEAVKNDDDDDHIVYYSNGQAIIHSVAPIQTFEPIPLCGNGVRENGEECDCGLEHMCTMWNCNAPTCQRHVSLWIIYLSLFLIILSVLAPLVAYFYFRNCYKKNYRNKFWSNVASSQSDGLKIVPKFSVLKNLKNCRQFSSKANAKNEQYRKAMRPSKLFFSKWCVKNSKATVSKLQGDANCDANLVHRTVAKPDSNGSKSQRLFEIFAQKFSFVKGLVLKRNGNLDSNTKNDVTHRTCQTGSEVMPTHVLTPHINNSLANTIKPGADFVDDDDNSCYSSRLYTSSSNVTLLRPRCKPPPPPTSPLMLHSERPNLLSPHSSLTLPCPQLSTEKLNRPKLPPPPRPLQPDSSNSMASNFSVVSGPQTLKQQPSKRALLPQPPPPPPPQSAVKVNSSFTLPNPPSFAPPLLPTGVDLTSIVKPVILKSDISKPIIVKSDISLIAQIEMEAAQALDSKSTDSQNLFLQTSSNNIDNQSLISSVAGVKNNTENCADFVDTTSQQSNTVAGITSQISLNSNPLTPNSTSSSRAPKAEFEDEIEEDNNNEFGEDDDENDRYSISHKFADFDDDDNFESDFDENLNHY